MSVVSAEKSVRLSDEALTLFEGVRNMTSEDVLSRAESFSGLELVLRVLELKSTGSVFDKELETETTEAQRQARVNFDRRRSAELGKKHFCQSSAIIN